MTCRTLTVVREYESGGDRIAALVALRYGRTREQRSQQRPSGRPRRNCVCKALLAFVDLYRALGGGWQ